MTELPPEAAALLAAAQRRHDPSEADRERVLSRLHASLGVGAATAVTAGAAATASGAAAAAESAAVAEAAVGGKGALLGWKGALFTWKATKVMLATVAIGGAVGVSSVAVRRGEPSAVESAAHGGKSAAREQAAASPHVEAGEDLAATTSQGQDLAAARDREEVDVPAREHSARHEAGARAASLRIPRDERGATASREARVSARPYAKRGDSSRPARGTSAAHPGEERAVLASAAPEPTRLDPARATPTDEEAHERAPEPSRGDERTPARELAAKRASADSEGELALLRAALASLRDREPARALALLDEHEARYAHGAFATERRGLRVIALCSDGQFMEGKRERTSFLQEAASSPIAARVRAACTQGSQ